MRLLLSNLLLVRGLAWAPAAGVLCLATPALGDTSVTLRSWARVPSTTITLGDVADVRGDLREALAALPLKTPGGASDGWLSVDLESVRRAIDAMPEVDWGAITLRGGRCAVRLEGAPATPTPEGKGSASVPSGSSSEPAGARPARESGADAAPGTLRSAIISRLVGLYEAEPGDVRVVVEGGREGVDDPVPAGQVLVIEPGAASASGRVALRVDFLEGDAIVRSLNLAAQVQVRRSVLIASEPAARGETLSPARVHREERWLPAGAPAPLSEADLVRTQARRAIPAGTVLSASDVRSPVVVKRGEEVRVHVLSGGVRMTIRARALSEGREGDVVAFRSDSSKKTFDARMSSPGEAVMMVHPIGESPRAPAEHEGMVTIDGRVNATPAPRGRAGGWDVDDEELRAIDRAASGPTRTPSPAPASARATKPMFRDNRSPLLREAQERALSSQKPQGPSR